MLIKQFCEATGLPRDTVRFYVKRGLLRPEIGSRPGNQYQVFDETQVERATLIKTAQQLGFTLRQIADLGERYDAQEVGSEAKAAVLRAQIDGIAQQERELRRMRLYLSAKLSWVENGEIGLPPRFISEHATTKVASYRKAAASRP
jgi:MerR family copper efflux transcriptional regulator